MRRNKNILLVIFLIPALVRGQFFDVTTYGAVGDSSTDCVTAIRAAISAANAAGGGVVYVPAGRFILSDSIYLPSNIRLMGVSGGIYNGVVSSILIKAGSSSLMFTSANKNGVIMGKIASPYFSQGNAIENINIMYTGSNAPTSATGVMVRAGANFHLENVDLYGFYNNMTVQNGSYWTINACNFIFPVNYGLEVSNVVNPDEGDWSISNCAFSAGYTSIAAAGIFMSSSGGGKIVNCKFNTNGFAKWKYGIRANITGTTSDLLISNVSIENIDSTGIFISTTSGKYFKNILLTGVQIFNCAKGAFIKIDYDALNNENGNIVMNSLVFNGGNSQQILNIRNATRVRIGLGVFDNSFASPPVAFTNCLDTQIDYVNNVSVIALSDGSTITWDLNQGKNATVTLGGTGRTVAVSNPLPGQTYNLRVVQDGVGSRTISTWPSGTKWVNGTPPVLSTAANAIDLITLYFDGVSYYGTYSKGFN